MIPILPTTYLVLHSHEGNTFTKKPCRIFVKPDQIIMMQEVMLEVQYINEETHEPASKTRPFTRIHVPFSEVLIVQEPPELIAQGIENCINANLKEIADMQKKGLVVADGAVLNQINNAARKPKT